MFVVVTYTNVLVKDFTYGATFSVWRPSPTRTRWSHSFQFSLFKRSGWTYQIGIRQETRVPLLRYGQPGGVGIGDRYPFHFLSLAQ
jgi:hypothetical protein